MWGSTDRNWSAFITWATVFFTAAIAHLILLKQSTGCVEYQDRWSCPSVRSHIEQLLTVY